MLALDDLDELLDTAVLEGVLAGGRDPSLAARQFGAARVIAAGQAAESASISGSANVWSDEDLAFLREWSGVLGAAEIAERLGRRASAVFTQQIVRGLPTVMKHPDYLTGQKMADALGVDSHAVLMWIDRGLLAAERAPLELGRVWRMRRTAFYAWATNPLNWPCFIRSVRDPERIADEKLRRLIARRAEQWGDEWWSLGEVAAYHGTVHQFINKHIRDGRLPATDWGNWWVRRSDATRLRVYRISDGQLPHRGTPAEDAFIVLAAAVGIPWPHIARMMGGRRTGGGTVTRHSALMEKGLVPGLIRANGLPVLYRDGLTWADWRPIAHRFPALARTRERLAAGRKLTRFERALLAGVLSAFLRWHYPERRRFDKGDAAPARLREAQVLFEETVLWT